MGSNNRLCTQENGYLSFCLDYRKLINLARLDSYLISRMDERIDSLGEANSLSRLDTNSGYWQVGIENEDSDETAFTSHRGLYRFVRMPVGFKNASGTFKKTMKVIIASIKRPFALLYPDDIVILSKKPE